jgi:hypothetical protein
MALSVQVLLRPRFTLPSISLLGFSGVLLFTRVIPSGYTPYAVIFITLGMWMGLWALLGSFFTQLRQRLDWQDIARGCAYGFGMGWFGAYISGQMTPLEAVIGGGMGGAIASLVGNTYGYTPLAATCFFSFMATLGVATLFRFLTGELTVMGVFFSVVVPLLFCYRIGLMIEQTKVFIQQEPREWLEDFARVSKTPRNVLPKTNDDKTIDIDPSNVRLVEPEKPWMLTTSSSEKPSQDDRQLIILYLMVEERLSKRQIGERLIEKNVVDEAELNTVEEKKKKNEAIQKMIERDLKELLERFVFDTKRPSSRKNQDKLKQIFHYLKNDLKWYIHFAPESLRFNRNNAS